MDFIVEKVFGIEHKEDTSTSAQFGYSGNLLESLGLVLIGIGIVLFFIFIGFLVYKVSAKI